MKKDANPSDSALRLGARLRELRRKAHLTQSEVAGRMGAKGKGARSVVSRLEHGRYEPRRKTLAGYLEACGAGLADVADLLGTTTTPPDEPAQAQAPTQAQAQAQADRSLQPTADGSQPQAGDKERRKPGKTKKEETREQKLAAIERKARRLVGRAMLEEMLYDMLKSGLPAEAVQEQKALAEHGRRTFELLARTRRSRFRLRARTLECKGVTPEQTEQVEEIIGRVFQALEDSGDLERRPEFDPEQVLAGRQKLVPPRKAEDRVMDELRQELETWGSARNKVTQQIRTEYVRLLTEQGLTADQIGKLCQSLFSFCATAEGSPDREARQRKAQEFAARARTEETKQRLLEMAEYVFRRWDELKAQIPPRPKALQGRRG